MIGDARVFLDFDGVIIHAGYEQRDRRAMLFRLPDPSRVALLNRIVTETGARFVISSSWRISHPLPELRLMLKEAGFVGMVEGVTPDLGAGTESRRVGEIRSYMLGMTTPYVAIDDEDLRAGLGEARAVYVERGWWSGGLQASHVDASIARLRRQAERA